MGRKLFKCRLCSLIFYISACSEWGINNIRVKYICLVLLYPISIPHTIWHMGLCIILKAAVYIYQSHMYFSFLQSVSHMARTLIVSIKIFYVKLKIFHFASLISVICPELSEWKVIPHNVIIFSCCFFFSPWKIGGCVLVVCLA